MNLDLVDLTGTFNTLDIIIVLSLSFILATLVGFVYRATHRNISYSQSYVQTLVVVAMVIAVLMLVVGSNIARAFALVGAFSVIRFRNALKETRDMGFIFLVMAIGMATGTRFYALAIAATVSICVVIVLMMKLNAFASNIQRQVIKVQVPPDGDFDKLIEDELIKLTRSFELVSTETIRNGALLELLYTVEPNQGVLPRDIVTSLSDVNTGQRVTVLSGYDQTDL
ncbi:MAG: DUF4956 domain-containing protein [Gammaproteobacteria bacterium]|nr:DUF4956 domain-containing protein [Gammaproteobacteria bacterium]MAY02762.1 DUF4956 domain-containing protein [Gammaproteobacteria bacterium]|tara:strand:+ start:1173 stop:1850 length:678 start_codon:yes stop_codon:yes gene_type:complete